MKFKLSLEFANQDELVQEIERLTEEGVIQTLDEAEQYFFKHLIISTTTNKVEGG